MVELEEVSKDFGTVVTPDRVSLRVGPGEFLTLLGASGCGKTTTLRLIAGFETPTSGRVMLDGQDVSHLPPYQRPVNTVFQHYALFPHLSIFENVAFGLKLKGVPAADIDRAVRAALAQVKLQGYEARRPSQLSGGQKQRVALARALVLSPKVLLLDEPLGALDVKLRKDMQVELKNLHRELGITFILVTHDQEEALILSDRIAVMNEGRIEQLGAPRDLYERPRTRFVADFLGFTNMIEVTPAGVTEGRTRLRTAGGLELATRTDRLAAPFPADAPLIAAIRPERIQLRTTPGASLVRARVTELLYLGASTRLIARAATGETFTLLEPENDQVPAVGDEVDLFIEPEDVVALAPETRAP